jgi:hypothetical protein
VALDCLSEGGVKPSGQAIYRGVDRPGL